MPTSRQMVEHLECLNEAREKATALLRTIERCIRDTDKWVRTKPRRRARKDNNGGKRTGT